MAQSTKLVLKLFFFLGDKIVVKLNMCAQNLPFVESRNTIAEIKGSKYPEQVCIRMIKIKIML